MSLAGQQGETRESASRIMTARRSAHCVRALPSDNTRTQTREDANMTTETKECHEPRYRIVTLYKSGRAPKRGRRRLNLTRSAIALPSR